ncbi:MAG: sigma-70 family RNA polymerase sigma factor [Pseudomonadota bacterium]
MQPPDPKEELVTHLPFIRALATALVDDPSMAEDLVHTTVEKAWHGMARFQPGSDMKAWLFTIMRNTHFSQMRVAGREVCDTDGRAAATLVTAPVQEERLAFHDFLDALRSLPTEQRVALLLVGVVGYSYEEVADMCDVAVGTIKSRINRGRTRLASLMDMDANAVVLIDDKITMTLQNRQRGIW